MERLQILWIARSYTMPDAGVKLHTHPYYHMFYADAGQCNYTVNGEDSILKERQCLLVPKNTMHAYINSYPDIYEYLEIKFTVSSPILDTQLLHQQPLMLDNLLAGMLFKKILHEYDDLGSLADDAANAYLQALLCLFTEHQRYAKQRKFRFIDATSYSPLSQRIISYLECHYAENVSLDMLASVLGYNKSYLCVAFKKNTMITILDCLNMIRIRRAAELLAYSDYHLNDVATMCGYNSVSHFNRVFQKYVGTTPGQCKRAYPLDILFSPESQRSTLAPRSDRFMYSVLAQKRITPEMIRSHEALVQDESADD